MTPAHCLNGIIIHDNYHPGDCVELLITTIIIFILYLYNQFDKSFCFENESTLSTHWWVKHDVSTPFLNLSKKYTFSYVSYIHIIYECTRDRFCYRTKTPRPKDVLPDFLNRIQFTWCHKKISNDFCVTGL